MQSDWHCLRDPVMRRECGDGGGKNAGTYGYEDDREDIYTFT